MSEQRLTEDHAADLLINWELATTTAAKLAAPGPRMKPQEAAAEVTALRTAAESAVGHVHRITQLEAARDLGADSGETVVVDRQGWAKANAQSFRELLAPALAAAVERKPELAKGAGGQGSTTQVFGSAVTGAELGGVLSFLSAKVLGQFEPFQQNRLMLVAPNIVEIQREINVVPEDFRLWVCLHEQTHRVQFAAAPWLADHLKAKITELSTNTMSQADSLPEKLAEALKNMRRRTEQDVAEQGAAPDAGRPASSGAPRNRLLEAIQSPEDRATMSHLTAVMSLLEGHANVVMDAVDHTIVPTVKTIRRRFEERGRSRGPLENLIRKLLQLDVKAAQYRDGQKFVGQIVEAVGMEQFNRIWEGPEHLPTEEELHRPEAWIQRVLSEHA
ncbi:zinc-dependent metalloprotease [Nesterenkonia lacusekhoensis]|uniref:Coenzyme F420 biosynthesis associated uncharacterized protein n=1 Tax=Nesterenkonia lacusekhoensis TaxID=150832 RepID=A0ABS4T447_9MICC|nr:zinc-dependent metalloprotease [Nesterenkonia lacusekhoensis]MBP2319221.1 coenzyme F420 biosynthesis associated uncharacterized protein [Nesterenkonia lacusekhoensis]